MHYSPGALSSLLLTLGLLAVPLLIQVEREAPHTWQQRLILPLFEEEVARHTPRHVTGTFLPATIATSRTLTAADNPIIVTGPTRIAPGAVLTLAPGTQLFFHEFGSLVVAGDLVATGTAGQPISFLTNEQHPLNQVWGGITFTGKSVSRLAHVRIEDASPGISCLAGSRLHAQGVTILRGSMGIFTQSTTCQFIDTIVNGARDGIVARGVPVPALAGSSRVSGRHTNTVTIPLVSPTP